MDICKFSGSPVFAPGTSDLLVGAAVYVFNAGTTTPATTTQDYAGSTPHTYPIIVGSDGLIPAIYWGEGTFRVRVNVSETDNTPVWDFDGIKGEIVPAVDPGGTTVPDDERLKTGAIRFEFRDGELTGYVRANGRTIGSAASGATERANADTEALFKKYWNELDNAHAPVVGGRGANADSDWAANKQLTLPNARGAPLIGLDTMGNTAANVSQKSTTITTTNASATATVASATGLVRGMYVVSANVPAGTTITAISGTTITMSNAASATASGTAARFSMLRDAQAPGATGGAAYVNQNEAEMAPHNHNITDPGHIHEDAGGTNDTSGANFRRTNGNDFLLNVNPAYTGITVNSAGSGQAMNVMQPSIAVTVYIKL